MKGSATGNVTGSGDSLGGRTRVAAADGLGLTLALGDYRAEGDIQTRGVAKLVGSRLVGGVHGGWFSAGLEVGCLQKLVRYSQQK